MSDPVERDDWAIPLKFRKRYFKEFDIYQRYNKRPLTKDIFAELRCQDVDTDYGLDSPAFDLADIDHSGHLDPQTYVVACYLDAVVGRDKMPEILPKNLIPPSRRPSYTKSLQGLLQQLSFTPTPFNAYIRPARSTVCLFKAYGDLSNELWIAILSYLPKTTLLDACRTSKRFQEIGIPILYHAVRLRTFGLPRGPYAYYQEIPKYQNHTMTQQYRFLQQILWETPSYARFIRIFKWSNELAYTDRNFLPHFVDDERPTWRCSEPSKLFPLLKNVRYVDIDICALYTQAPADFLLHFSSAHTILLRGGMPDSLIQEILYGKCNSEFRRLVSDNIFTRNDTHVDEINEERRSNRQVELEYADPKTSKWSFRYRDLRVRISEAQTLYLAKVGNHSLGIYENRYHRPWTPLQDRLRRDWGVFIRKVEARGEGGEIGEWGGVVVPKVTALEDDDDVVLRELVLENLGWRREQGGE